MSKTVEYGYVVELLEKLGLEPHTVSDIIVNPEQIKVLQFVMQEDFDELTDDFRLKITRKLGENGRPIQKVTAFDMNTYEGN